MIIRAIALSSVMAVGLFTCSKNVRLNEPARSLELLEPEYAKKHAKRCTEVASFTVSAIPAETSGEREMDVLEVKARNEARAKGATHLVMGAPREWGCKKDGTKSDDSERVCREADAQAMTCVVGRGT